MGMPAEIRLRIFTFLFSTVFSTTREQRFPHPLMATCKQLRLESLPILMHGFDMEICITPLSRFERDETAEDHVALVLSDRAVLKEVTCRPIVTLLGRPWGHFPAPARSWTEFCHTNMTDLVHLCGIVTLRTTCKELRVEVVITRHRDGNLALRARMPLADKLIRWRANEATEIEEVKSHVMSRLPAVFDDWRRRLTLTKFSPESIEAIAQEFARIARSTEEALPRPRRFFMISR